MLFIINHFSMINAQIIMKCFSRSDWHSSTSRHEMTYMDRRMVQLTDRHTFQDFQDNMLHDVNFSTKRPYVVEVLVLIDNSLYQKQVLPPNVVNKRLTKRRKSPIKYYTQHNVAMEKTISPNTSVRFPSVSNQDKGLQIVLQKNTLLSIVFPPELQLQC